MSTVTLTLPELTVEQLVNALIGATESKLEEIVKELRTRTRGTALGDDLFEFIFREGLKACGGSASLA
jgi:hypothetical protein